MSIRSRLRDWLVGAPETEGSKAPTPGRPSRHERREAGRRRHRQTGGPAWEPGDKVDEGTTPGANPDAAPEILGG